jgi:glycyl-tRNA synthetase beta chain
MPRFVLEIGTEELPPRFLPPAMQQLGDAAESALARARLSHQGVTVLGTPRRLVLIVAAVAARQVPAVREERGPAARIAFDEEGKPTRAAAGFARRHGLAPEDLVRRQTDQGEYVFAIVHEPEAAAAEALAGLLPDLITGLSFPKSMRWGAESIRFGRPIRWLLALLGDEVVRFSLAGLHSGRAARGHPVLANEMFEVPDASAYEEELARHFVVVDPARRRAAIEQQVAELADSVGAQVVNGELLDETTYLVEWPTAALGRFERDFLRLPRPVLVEEMRHVQSYFPLEDERGALLPNFVAVRDGGRERIETVVRGWEYVLIAKLIDAGFFYDQDLKTPLEDRVGALRGVVFQEKLGTMYEKVARLRRVAAEVASQAGLPPAPAAALDRAALLCKADLTTDVVTDLPDLQGVMGGVYARHFGEPEQVAQAVSEHYRPRFAGDAVPSTDLGRALALADKVDTIAALFAVGVIPTGSADPYGMRREAAGALSIALAMEAAVPLTPLVGASLDVLAEQFAIGRPRQEIVSEVTAFIAQRLDTYLREERGVRYDLVNAALAAGFDDLRAAAARAEALQRLSRHPDFLPTVIAATRVSNIARGTGNGAADPARFEAPVERDLWAAAEEAEQAVEARAAAGDWETAFRALAGLREIIDRYFVEVLVMAEDPELRRNRLATCRHVDRLFRRLADFSQVVQA